MIAHHLVVVVVRSSVAHALVVVAVLVAIDLPDEALAKVGMSRVGACTMPLAPSVMRTVRCHSDQTVASQFIAATVSSVTNSQRLVLSEVVMTSRLMAKSALTFQPLAITARS